jgi:hypothetical protein
MMKAREQRCERCRIGIRRFWIRSGGDHETAIAAVGKTPLPCRAAHALATESIVAAIGQIALSVQPAFSSGMEQIRPRDHSPFDNTEVTP